MFQFLRRVSGSLLPRPDRPWRDDATSHAPTIGRKRRLSVAEQDHDDAPSATKKSKNGSVQPDTECDSASEGESSKGDSVPHVEGREVKEVTKGVNEVDLEDKDKEDASSVSLQPEGVPLPDSPSGSPEPGSESPEPANSDAIGETEDQEHAGDGCSVASSAPEDVNDAEEEVKADPITESADALPDGTTPAQEVTVSTVESGLHDVSDTLEVKA